MIRFSRGLYRVHRLRKGALPLSLNIVPAGMLRPPCRVLLLESAAIDDPITIGVFHPAIILPSRVVPSLAAPDLAAILAHEYGHIRRKDFLVHLLCQFIVLPIAWHPGMQYLMAKISQTRELACDDYAALRLGKRITYARTLVRLASLCLHAPRSSAMELGIFDGDNLEDRIMMLTEKRASLSRAGLIGLALTTTLLFASSAMLARALSLQETSASASSTRFAGTWHWMFKGRSFATMTLTQTGSQITGSATESKIALDDNGELSQADPSENRTPVPIARARLEGDALHVTVGNDAHPMEFTVTLKDANHAEIHPLGAPPNMKPILAERIN
jgi:Zn-dependent protease with chaperone function